MRKKLTSLAALLALLWAAGAGAGAAPVVTRETYQNIPTEVAGQRLFLLPGCELDVYAARFGKEAGALCFDVYPDDSWDEAARFSLKIDGRAAEGWTQAVEKLEGGGYAYRLTGPGMPEPPASVELTLNGDAARALTISVRTRPFGRCEPAFFLEHEVMQQGVFEALRAADDPMQAARTFLPEGAQLLDCSVGERYASIDYRLHGTRAVVDYYGDGHVEKMQRDDDDSRIFFASTLDEYARVVSMNDRIELAGREELRPPRKDARAFIRTGGLAFRIEGYRLDGDRLSIDWTASSKVDGLLAMMGHAQVPPGASIDEWLDNTGSLDPMSNLKRLGGARGSLKGTRSIDFENGMPARPFDVTLTLYAVKPLVPVELSEEVTSPRSGVPGLFDQGDGDIFYASVFERGEDGSTGFHDELMDERNLGAGLTEDEIMRSFEQAGYFKLMRKLQLTVTIEG